jgi:hypothetical protein
MDIGEEELVKIITLLLGLMGVLIGVIWSLLRKEIKNIEESNNTLKENYINLRLTSVTKEECKNNMKDCNKGMK